MFSITTPRLYIREIQACDAEQIYTAMSCPEIDSMHSNGFRTIADVCNYISVLMQEYANQHYRTLAIADKVNNELYGAITLDIHPKFLRAEIGYWIAIPYRNKGYASEAVRAVIEYGFSTLHLIRIQATHSINNPASGRVLEKAGMTFEGTLRHYYELNGISSDEKMYAIVSSDMI